MTNQKKFPAYEPPSLETAAIGLCNHLLSGSASDYNYHNIWGDPESGNASDYDVEDL